MNESQLAMKTERVHSLENRVLDSIRETRLLAPGDRVGVAVSGGADSVALLRILWGIREELGLRLMVVHFDHCLRGAESDGDAQFVTELAPRYGLDLALDRQDVAAAAQKNKWNLEEAARRLRYTFFERLAQEGQASRIAVAHTADDQAETVLAHLIRGTGPTGLAGIYPVAGVVVRPLLGIRRRELRDYLRAHGETWREDSTNADTRRLRARVRTCLVPLLEREFSPQAVERLAELARLSREEQDFWSEITEDRFRALVKRSETGLSIRARDLIAPLDLPGPAEGRQSHSHQPAKALTERLVRRLYEGLHGSRQGLGARHVEQVIRLAAVAGSGRIELPGRIVVEKSFGQLRFMVEEGKAARTSEGLRPLVYAYAIELPERGSTTVSVPELGSRFHLKVVDWAGAERETRDGRSALDTALLRMPLILRNWRPGDAYRPRGRRQIHKLKQMFAEERVPVRERAGWPVLESAGQVLWARGMPPAHEFCVRGDAASGVVIEEERL